MTELLFGVLVLGAIVLFGIAFYNAWQLKKAKEHELLAPARSNSPFYTPWINWLKKKRAPFNTDEHAPKAPLEIVVEDPQIAQNNPPPPSESVSHRMIEGLAQMETLTNQRSLSGLDERIDLMIEIFLPLAMSGSKLMPWIKRVRLAGKKPVLVDASQNGKNEWELLRINRLYKTLRLGVQLANRNGPLNKIELDEFETIVTQISTGLGADHYWMSSPQKILERAKQLDQFAAQLDVGIVIHIKADQPWHAVDVDRALTQKGLRRILDHPRWVMPDLSEQGSLEPIFSVNYQSPHFGDADDRLLFRFETARVPMDRNGFLMMSQYAQAIALALGGYLVDEHNQPLNPEQLIMISEQLNEHYRIFHEAGFAPGDALCLRLFS